MTLQELISRGRFVMADAPSRREVFEAVDGRRTAHDIALLTLRHANNVRRDLAILRDVGLIQPAGPERGNIYEKVPLARTISAKYFAPVAKRPSKATEEEPLMDTATPRRNGRRRQVRIPSESDILEIARKGEDQLYEFKAPGAEAPKLTKEIAAMLNTSAGGLIFYGIEDDGTIVGTDISRQQLDQPLQNSVKNGISPAASISLHAVSVLGSEILVIAVPPWNRRGVYQYQERVYIRKGTNTFAAKTEELRELFNGRPVI